MLKKSILLSLTLAISSCASISGDSSSKMVVLTPGAKNSICMISNDYTKVRAFPPQTIMVKNTSLPINIVCTASGNRKKSITISPKISKNGGLNVFSFSIPGALYDHNSGALYSYPDVVEIDFNNVAVINETLPEYEDDIIRVDNGKYIEDMAGKDIYLSGEKAEDDRDNMKNIKRDGNITDLLNREFNK